jgi:glycosyltransferase involved in cell wall biosynthesis
MDDVFISICIPAYKNTTFLKRLLDSIAIQTFRNFEVILTDDSPDDSVRNFVAAYKGFSDIQYRKNDPTLGTPENWNEGLRRAKGEWIKIMHDDDWFAHKDSLARFAEAARTHPGHLIFSAFTNHFLEKGKKQSVSPSTFRLKKLQEEPYSLLSRNVIGPPSVTMHVNDRKLFYDKRFKWVVDIDFYISRLKHEPFYYLQEPLVNVGMSSQQVTTDCVFNREVQLPENFLLLEKVGIAKFQNVLVYDAWWRLLRNLEVTNTNEIAAAGYKGELPSLIQEMISTQASIPRPLLTNGIVSKITMIVHYLRNRNHIHH